MIVVDMKKPETCADCPIINGEYGICEILDREVWGIPPKDCPIVGEIPDEHGDLIDANAFKKRNKDARMEKKLKNGAIQIIELGDIFAYFIAKKPVILEANK